MTTTCDKCHEVGPTYPVGLARHCWSCVVPGSRACYSAAQAVDSLHRHAFLRIETECLRACEGRHGGDHADWCLAARDAINQQRHILHTALGTESF